MLKTPYGKPRISKPAWVEPWMVTTCWPLTGAYGRTYGAYAHHTAFDSWEEALAFALDLVRKRNS